MWLTGACQEAKKKLVRQRAIVPCIVRHVYSFTDSIRYYSILCSDCTKEFCNTNAKYHSSFLLSFPNLLQGDCYLKELQAGIELL